MTSQERATFIDTFLTANCQILLLTKGVEYSRGEEDVNSNFKRLAAEIGGNPNQILYIYLKKHLDAISYYIKTNEVKSEPIESRIADAVNYLLILASLIQEEKDANKTTRTERAAPRLERTLSVIDSKVDFLNKE